MQCEEREKIFALLLEAVTAYANAVQAMKDLHGKALKRSFALLDSAQAAYEDCRQVLIAHERSHGCGIKSGETATAIKEKRRSGFKPDKGPQQSFHLSRSFDAESNAQAVRKFTGWMQHRRGLGRLGYIVENAPATQL